MRISELFMIYFSKIIILGNIEDTEFIIQINCLPTVYIHDNDRLVTYVCSTKQKGKRKRRKIFRNKTNFVLWYNS